MEQSCIRANPPLEQDSAVHLCRLLAQSHTSSTPEEKQNAHVTSCRLRALCKHARIGLQARACISSTPLSPMLKPSIFMSRLVGRDVSTPVTVRVLAAATAAADCSGAWPFAGASARLARLTSLCRSVDTRFQRAPCQVRLRLASLCRRSRQPAMAPGRRRREAHLCRRANSSARRAQTCIAGYCRRGAAAATKLCAVAHDFYGALANLTIAPASACTRQTYLAAVKHTSDTPLKVL